MGTFTAYGGDSSFVLENAMYGTPFVETTYSTDIFSTLDAGFTCTSGRKYRADHQSIIDMKTLYQAASDAVQSTIQFNTYTNTQVSLSLSDALTDITELFQNYYNAVIYVY